MKKDFYKIGFWAVLAIAVVIIIFMSASSTFKGESEKALISKGYEFISVSDTIEEDMTVAILEMNSQGRDRFYEILTGLQALIQTYGNVNLYRIIIYQGTDSCSYTIDGDLYREYDSANIEDWFDSSLILHFQMKKGEICE